MSQITQNSRTLYRKGIFTCRCERGPWGSRELLYRETRRGSRYSGQAPRRSPLGYRLPSQSIVYKNKSKTGHLVVIELVMVFNITVRNYPETYRFFNSQIIFELEISDLVDDGDRYGRGVDPSLHGVVPTYDQNEVALLD